MPVLTDDQQISNLENSLFDAENQLRRLITEAREVAEENGREEELDETFERAGIPGGHVPRRPLHQMVLGETPPQTILRLHREINEITWKRDRLVDVAHEVADEYEWCEVFDDIMRDLGLPTRQRNYRVQVSGTFTVYIDVDDVADVEDLAAHIDKDDIANALTRSDIDEWEVEDYEAR